MQSASKNTSKNPSSGGSGGGSKKNSNGGSKKPSKGASPTSLFDINEHFECSVGVEGDPTKVLVKNLKTGKKTILQFPCEIISIVLNLNDDGTYILLCLNEEDKVFHANLKKLFEMSVRGLFTSLDDYGCRRDDENHKRLYVTNMKTNKLKQFDVEFDIESLELVKKKGRYILNCYLLDEAKNEISCPVDLLSLLEMKP